MTADAVDTADDVGVHSASGYFNENHWWTEDYNDRAKCDYLPVRSRCLHPGQQQGRR